MLKILWITLFTSSYALAALPQSGLIVFSKGDVKILSQKEKKGPSLLFQGEKYFYRKARMAEKIYAKEIVLSGTNGKAKIIFTNGDQLNIGPSSMASIPHVNKEDQSSSMEIIYGKIRAVVHPKKEHKKLKVETKNSVTGVRGTDFVSVHHDSTGSFTTVLRGKVEVENKATNEKIVLQAGKTAKVVKAEEKKEDTENKESDINEAKKPNEVTKTIEVKSISKQEIQDIKKALLTDENLSQADLKEEEKKEIASFEKKAKENLVSELASNNLNEKEKVESNTLEDINRKSVEKFEQKASDRELEWEPEEDKKPKSIIKANVYQDGLDYFRFGFGALASLPESRGEFYTIEASYLPRYQWRNFHVGLELSLSYLEEISGEAILSQETTLQFGYALGSYLPIIKIGNKHGESLDEEGGEDFAMFGIGLYKKVDYWFIKEVFFEYNEVEIKEDFFLDEIIIGISL